MIIRVRFRLRFERVSIRERNCFPFNRCLHVILSYRIFIPGEQLQITAGCFQLSLLFLLFLLLLSCTDSQPLIDGSFPVIRSYPTGQVGKSRYCRPFFLHTALCSSRREIAAPHRSRRQGAALDVEISQTYRYLYVSRHY